VPESPNESEEDVKNVLVKLFEDVLHVNTAQNMMLGGSHRLPRCPGPYNQGRPRDIVMRLAHFPDRVEFFVELKTYRATNRNSILMNSFPQIDDRRRKLLQPILGEAR